MALKKTLLYLLYLWYLPDSSLSKLLVTLLCCSYNPLGASEIRKIILQIVARCLNSHCYIVVLLCERKKLSGILINILVERKSLKS